MMKNQAMVTTPQQIRYVAIGDSYTIGLGVDEKDRWPNILTEKLRSDGVDIVLIKNLAVSGWTTQDTLDLEIPELEKLKPNFVTILIGANDSFRGMEVEVFRQNFINILDKTQEVLPDPKKVVVLTIPNYAASPQGKIYGANKDTEKDIQKYNNVINEEADKRGIKVVDLFKLTADFSEPSYFIADGLHPSALQYQKWADLIYPDALKILK